MIQMILAVVGGNWAKIAGLIAVLSFVGYTAYLKSALTATKASLLTATTSVELLTTEAASYRTLSERRGTELSVLKVSIEELQYAAKERVKLAEAAVKSIREKAKRSAPVIEALSGYAGKAGTTCDQAADELRTEFLKGYFHKDDPT